MTRAARSPDLFDYAASAAARDAGLKLVSDNNADWIALALARVKQIAAGWCGTGEDIRLIVGIQPAHPNAWGALINSAQRRGLIEKTGVLLPMKQERSHARLTPEYVRTTTEARQP